ncbi:hypothetical protein ACIQUM_07455 [Amycolatopsis azurea]|uniref:hypothetical protein n=1 Tax=Amycolatopsis azurea TaxID=36819 RepID=UPI0037FC5B4B
MAAAQTPADASGQSASRSPALPDKAHQSGSERRARVVVRLPPDVKQRVQYWAHKRGFSSVNEYIAEAAAEQVRRENLDYDLPTLEIARINELSDQVKALSTNCANLERVVMLGFDSLLQLTRGDNYLLDNEGTDS